MSREDSYAAVQRNAMKVWQEGADFLTERKADREVTAHLPEADLTSLFDLSYHLKHVDDIFNRVFNQL